MDRSEILKWLSEEDEGRLETLWYRTDDVRRANVGDEVHLRGLIEFSNYCVRRCHYCGLRADNHGIVRYRMTADEILDCARKAVEFKYGTVVLQSGEDTGVETEWMASVIRRIKSETPLAVTLSLGERGDEDLEAWRRAGADRYLLRFETSNPVLYERIHPSLPGRRSDRVAILRTLRRLGYEVGSGVMIGLPGQTCEDLADDIELFRELDLDMIGVGPYILHPDTPLGRKAVVSCRLSVARPVRSALDVERSKLNVERSKLGVEGSSTLPTACCLLPAARSQVPDTELMTYKVIALARIVCPLANIPSTTALATVNLARGRELGLQRGANVVMPNLTPPGYRALYEIYPSKACIRETAEECHLCLESRIAAIGRTIGAGRGDSTASRDRVQSAPMSEANS